jgi:hypothetical protein
MAGAVILVGGMMLHSGCANWDGYAGVQNAWRDAEVPEWKPGETTAAEVISFLGPPSQLIPMHEETVLYYMREGKDGKALLLLVWNTGTQTTEYDRAIFIFDKKGVLKNFAYSNEVLPYEGPEGK